MLSSNVCTTPAAVLGVLVGLGLMTPGPGALAADGVPVVLYESDHLGYGENPYGFLGNYGRDVAIDGDALMVADPVFDELRYVTSFRQAPDDSWVDRSNFAPGVSVDIEDQRALIGDDYECWADQDWEDCANGYGIGAVGYFERAGDGRWLPVGEPLRPAAADLYGFGGDVDLSDWTAAATAAYGGWHDGTAVLIFEQRAGAWEGVFETRFDGSGVSIALEGETLLVGEPRGQATGVVHVFMKNARGRWRPRGTFVPEGLQPGAAFGSSVALDGNRALIGASGANVAYVFERGTPTGVWRERVRLEVEPGPPAGGFGASVALDGDMALVGRPEGPQGPDADVGDGSVHVFVRASKTEWPRRAILASSDGTPRSAFGSSLAIDQTNVAVGAPFQEENGAGDTVGAAYYFDLSLLGGEVRFVDIDVKPGSDDNVLDPASTGNVWVAVLSAMDFDALQADPATVAFGPGAAAPNRNRVEDTNADGLPDLKLRFAIQDIGVSCEVTTLQLTGRTYAGEAIAGQETVEVVGCGEIVVKVDPLKADRGVVDLAESSFYVTVMSRPGFDPATVAAAEVSIAEFGGKPRGYGYRDKNGDGVPDLRLRYKTKDVLVSCGDHDIVVEVATVDDPADYPAYATWHSGTLRITVIGC